MIWLLLLSLLCMVAATHQESLPLRFLADEQEILTRMATYTPFEAYGDSFDNLAWVFRALRVSNLTISLFGFFVSTLGLMVAIWRSRVESLSVIEFAVVCFWLLSQTVYIGMLSKEIVISTLMFVLILCKDSRFIILLFTVCAALIAVYFRTYWSILIPPVLLLYFGPMSFRKPLFLFLVVVALFACLSIDFRIQYGKSLDFAREMVNETRDPSEVGSLIVSFIPGGNLVSDVANALIILATFVLPVPLLISGVVSQMIGGIGAYFSLATIFSRWTKRSPLVDADRFGKLSFCFLVAFLALQAVFEPDYGSFIRHLSPISPLFVYLLLTTRPFAKVAAQTPGETTAEPVRFDPQERRWLKAD